ncbi:hypothetical protein C6B38_04440 [Spiroplasma sp. ChiS]|nr:hypothetical protein C6B38_04440 [Spiroplasma sp. ChiS]
MNKYILCYRSEKGNRPCKNPLGEYITGTDIEDVNINSTWDWEYLINKYGEKNLIILKMYNVRWSSKKATLVKGLFFYLKKPKITNWFKTRTASLKKHNNNKGKNDNE